MEFIENSQQSGPKLCASLVVINDRYYIVVRSSDSISKQKFPRDSLAYLSTRAQPSHGPRRNPSHNAECRHFHWRSYLLDTPPTTRCQRKFSRSLALPEVSMLATYVITIPSITRTSFAQEEEIIEKKSSIDHDTKDETWDLSRHIPTQPLK